MQSHIIHTFFMMFLFTCFVSSTSALMIGNAHIEPKSRMSLRTTPLDLKDEGSVLSPTEQAQVANVTAEHAQLAHNNTAALDAEANAATSAWSSPALAVVAAGGILVSCYEIALIL